MSGGGIGAIVDVAAEVALGEQLARIARQEPARTALVLVARDGTETSLSYAEFDAAVNRAARVLGTHGVDASSTVVVALPTSLEHVVATWAAWRRGALVVPLSATLPAPERDALLELASPVVSVARWEDGSPAHLQPEDLADPAVSASPVPSAVPHPGKAVSSGGTTGRPKLIIDVNPLVWVPGRIPDLFATVGVRQGQVHLVCGPLYHNAGFAWANMVGIPCGHTVVLMERFDAARALELIELHRVNFALLVPTMMRRMLDAQRGQPRDLSSIESILHTAAPCDASLKRAWCELIGPERVWEGFGATESVGICLVRGDEWLAHPDTVGRPFACDLRILDDEGAICAPGTVGEIVMRPQGRRDAPFRYLGAEAPRTTEDGFHSVGDMGWVDADGYLHLADRRSDLIITGGSNVYPAEVEAALLEHPAIADAAVIGLADDDRGQVIHAVVEVRPGVAAPTADEVRAHCADRLAAYKLPRSVEFVDLLPRNEVGKVRRSTLIAERVAP